METIFDHNVTQSEMNAIGLVGISKEWYLKHASGDTVFLNLADLFWHRGKKAQARAYADKLSPDWKNDWYRTILHP